MTRARTAVLIGKNYYAPHGLNLTGLRQSGRYAPMMVLNTRRTARGEVRLIEAMWALLAIIPVSGVHCGRDNDNTKHANVSRCGFCGRSNTCTNGWCVEYHGGC